MTFTQLEHFPLRLYLSFTIKEKHLFHRELTWFRSENKAEVERICVILRDTRSVTSMEKSRRDFLNDIGLSRTVIKIPITQVIFSHLNR